MMSNVTKFLELILWEIKILLLLLRENLYWLYVNYKNGISKNLNCLVGKTAIVTGGNSGIGYMTSVLLASRGCKVIIACRRNASKETEQIIKETNNPNIKFKNMDLSKFESVRKFAEEIKKEETKIDFLINNAGMGYSKDMVTEDGFDTIMQTNFFGHFLLTHLLIDLIRPSQDGRIVFLTSALSKLHEVSLENLYPKSEINVESRLLSYSNSKACAIFAATKMAEKLAKYRIKVNAADPGISETPIFDSLQEETDMEIIGIRIFFKLLVLIFGTDWFKSAQTSFHLAASRDVESGVCYFRCQPMPKISRQDDKKLLEEIWKESEKITGLRPGERL